MQKLESLAYEARPIHLQRQVVYSVGDLEGLSAVAFYSKGDSGGYLKFTKDGLVIPIIGLGIPLHDTYNLDSEGNVSGGHSTVNLDKGGKVYMPHGSGMPSIKSGSGY